MKKKKKLRFPETWFKVKDKRSIDTEMGPLVDQNSVTKSKGPGDGYVKVSSRERRGWVSSPDRVERKEG